MSNIKNLGMGEAISSKNYINIINSFFGLCQKVIYVPTGSRVKVVCQEYSADEGERLEKLLSFTLDKLESELASKGKPATTAVGNYQLQACVSDDRQSVPYNYSTSTTLCTTHWKNLFSSKERKQRLSPN